MNLTDFFNKTGEAFDWFFINIIERLGMFPNKFYFFIGWSCFLIWMYMMAKYNKEAKENNTLK